MTTKSKKTTTAAPQGIPINIGRVRYYLREKLNAKYNGALRDLALAEPHDESLTDDNGRVVLDAETNRPLKQRTLLRTYEQLESSTRTLVSEVRAEEALAVAARTSRAGGAAAPVPADALRARKPAVYAEELTLLRRKLVRLSKEAPYHLAAYACCALHELLTFGFERCVAEQLKTLKVRHLVASGVKELDYKILYVELKAFKAAESNEQVRALARDNRAREAAEAKRLGVAPAQLSAAKPRETVRAPFAHYVDPLIEAICATRRGRAQGWANISRSAEMRQFCSALILEFIEKQCSRLHDHIGYNKTKTVTSQAVLDVMKQAVDYGHINEAAALSLVSQAAARVAQYEAQRPRHATKGQASGSESEAADAAGAAELQPEASPDTSAAEDSTPCASSVSDPSPVL